MFSISILGVILAAIAYFIIGFLLHGPVAGKLWMRLAGIQPTGNEKFSDMYGQMLWNLVSNLVTAVVLAVVANVILASGFAGTSQLCAGLWSAILIWVAGVAGSSMEVIWLGRKLPMWCFGVVASLIGLVAMGLIIGAL